VRCALATRLLVPVFVIGSVIGVSEARAQAPASTDAKAPAASAEPPARPDIGDVLVEGTSEWMIGGAAGFGVGRRNPADNSSYALQTLSWGRVLTGPVGPALIRGRFEWAVEVVPIFGQYDPDRAYGVGITPLVWRWNLDKRGPIVGFGEVGGGGLWTNTPVPDGTSSGNFTAHVAAGVRILTRPDSGAVIAYRFHHISNGNRVDRNPGINAHMVYFGWTFLRPARR
jgi:hypothetical protein